MIMNSAHHEDHDRRLPPLTALRCFEAAARHLNFTHAAADLHVTPSAVSHQIKDLEDWLGVVLFRRTGRSLALTEAGRTLQPEIRRGFDAFARGIEALRRSARTEALTVSVSPSIAIKWLVPHLREFRAAHPKIDVRISADLRLPRFAEEGVDLAVHYGDGRYPGLAVERLASNAVAPMCSPDLLARIGPIDRPADLARATLLHDGGPDEAGSMPYDWADWLRRHDAADVDASLGLRFGTSADVLTAAAAGAGVALGKTALAVDDVKAGRLVMLFDAVEPEPLAYYLVYPSAPLPKPAVAVFRDWLFATFGQP